MFFSGYFVIIPDYYRGKMKDPFTSPQEETVKFLIDESNWTGQLKSDFENSILPLLERNGAKSIGTLGKSVHILRSLIFRSLISSIDPARLYFGVCPYWISYNFQILSDFCYYTNKDLPFLNWQTPWCFHAVSMLNWKCFCVLFWKLKYLSQNRQGFKRLDLPGAILL